jgi:hypothetical protein
MAYVSGQRRTPMIVGAGGAKRPLGSTSQRDLVRASLQLCPPPRDKHSEDQQA